MTKTLSPAMRRAMDILALDGFVSTSNGVLTNTMVALMARGLIRERNRAGEHVRATTRNEDHAKVMAIHIGTWRDSCASHGCIGCVQWTAMDRLEIPLPVQRARLLTEVGPA